MGQNRVFRFLALWFQVDQKWPNVKLFNSENKVTKWLSLKLLRMAFALRMKTKLNKKSEFRSSSGTKNFWTGSKLRWNFRCGQIWIIEFKLTWRLEMARLLNRPPLIFVLFKALARGNRRKFGLQHENKTIFYFNFYFHLQLLHKPVIIRISSFWIRKWGNYPWIKNP